MIVDVNVSEDPKFEFRISGSKKVWRMPSANDLPIGIRQSLTHLTKPLIEAQKAGKEPATEHMVALADAQIKLLEQYCPGISDIATEKALAAILQAWFKHSGIDLGELEASAAS